MSESLLWKDGLQWAGGKQQRRQHAACEMSMRNEGGAGGVLTLLTPLLGVAVPATACQLPGRLRDPGGITQTDDLARKNVQAAMPCHA